MKRDHSAIYLRVLSVSFNFLSVDRKSSPVIASIEWNKMNRDWILAKANMDMGQCVLHVFRKLIPNDLTIYFDWFVELRRNYRTRLHWVSTFAAIMRTLTPHTDSEYIYVWYAIIDAIIVIICWRYAPFDTIRTQYNVLYLSDSIC